MFHFLGESLAYCYRYGPIILDFHIAPLALMLSVSIVALIFSGSSHIGKQGKMFHQVTALPLSATVSILSMV
jgi:hypothetical protein